MLYTCLSKCCHYLFQAESEDAHCPDCGSPLVRPANAKERLVYLTSRLEQIDRLMAPPAPLPLEAARPHRAASTVQSAASA